LSYDFNTLPIIFAYFACIIKENNGHFVQRSNCNRLRPLQGSLEMQCDFTHKTDFFLGESNPDNASCFKTGTSLTRELSDAVIELILSL
jgi:hypothetical protein